MNIKKRMAQLLMVVGLVSSFSFVYAKSRHKSNVVPKPEKGKIEEGTGDIVSKDPDQCDNCLDPECACFFSYGSPGYWDYQHYRWPGMTHEPINDHWYCPRLGRYMTGEDCHKTEEGGIVCACEDAYRVNETVPGHEEKRPARYRGTYASSLGGEGYR